MRALSALHLLARRRWVEIGKRTSAVPTRHTVFKHRQRGAAYGAVAAIVEYNRQDGQILHGGYPMSNHRVSEHVGAVAKGRDHEIVRRSEFRTERCAKSPAESAGRPEREERAGLFARAMIRPQRVFVDDDGIFADRLADDTRQILR